MERNCGHLVHSTPKNQYNIYDNSNYLEIMLERSKGQKTLPQIFINNRSFRDSFWFRENS